MFVFYGKPLYLCPNQYVRTEMSFFDQDWPFLWNGSFDLNIFYSNKMYYPYKSLEWSDYRLMFCGIYCT